MASKWKTCIIEYVEMTFVQQLAILIINTLVGVMNILINGFLIYALKKLKKLNTASYRFMMFLSISDLSLGIFQLVVQTLPYIKDKQTSSIVILIMQFALYFIAPFSACMIMIIALDRYVHMKYLTYYNTVMTVSRARLVVLYNVALNLTTATILTLSSVYGFFFVYHTMLTCLYLLVILGTFILYLVTYRSIRRRTANLTIARDKSRKKVDANRGFAKGMLFVLLSLVICYIPNHAIGMARNVINHAGRQPPSTFQYVLLWAIILSYMNGTLNALALILCNKQLRKFVVTTFSCRRREEPSAINSVVIA